jgi:hypothetical protein
MDAERSFRARYQPRCAICGRFVGADCVVVYPRGPQIPGVPDSGPHDPMYTCQRCLDAEVHGHGDARPGHAQSGASGAAR